MVAPNRMTMKHTLSTPLVLAVTLAFGHAQAPRQPRGQLGFEGSLPGAYERTPVENGWHQVTIQRGKDGSLTWKNAAGKEWMLEGHNEGSEIWTTKDCPYPEQQLIIAQDAAGKVTGLQFNNETYRPVGGGAAGRVLKPKGKGAPAEFVFGRQAAITGKLEQIKTYDHDGKAVFPFYIRTQGNLIVRAAPDFVPENADEEIDGMEVRMLGGDDSALEPYHGKTVTIRGQIGTGADLYCFGFGLYVGRKENIEVHPAGGGEAAVATPVSDGIDEFWKEAIAGWRAGPVRELDEAEVDGTIQTYDSSAKVKLMFEEKRNTGEIGYSITHRLVGARNTLEAVHEVRWETAPARTGPASYRLTEVIYDFRSSPAKKHSKESKMKKHFFDMSGKPDSVSGDYSTQELDAGAVSAVKEARSDWWANGLK